MWAWYRCWYMQLGLGTVYTLINYSINTRTFFSRTSDKWIVVIMFFIICFYNNNRRLILAIICDLKTNNIVRHLFAVDGKMYNVWDALVRFDTPAVFQDCYFWLSWIYSVIFSRCRYNASLNKQLFTYVHVLMYLYTYMYCYGVFIKYMYLIGTFTATHTHKKNVMKN